MGIFLYYLCDTVGMLPDKSERISLMNFGSGSHLLGRTVGGKYLLPNYFSCWMLQKGTWVQAGILF